MGRKTKLFSSLYFAKMPAAVALLALFAFSSSSGAVAQTQSQPRAYDPARPHTNSLQGVVSEEDQQDGSRPVMSEVDPTEAPQQLPTDVGTNMPMLPDGTPPVELPPPPRDPVILEPSDVMPMPARAGATNAEGAGTATNEAAKKADNALPAFSLPPEVPAKDGSEDSAFSLPESDDLFTTTGDGAESSFAFDKTPEEIETYTRRQAFDAALQGLLPLRPAEIRELLEHFDRTQQSVSVPVYPNPKPETVVQTVSLDPGAKPLTVLLAYGHITTINFVDATGAPWPVENITWAGNIEVGEPKPTNVESAEEAAYSNILRISPVSEFAYGNISIMMTGLRTPIIMTLETSRDVVHYRFDAIIPENGPLAKVSIIGNNEGSNISAGDEDLTAVLEGIMPAGAEKLVISGVDGRTSAYRFNGLTYVRTPLTLLSPGWSASMASADGMNAYAMEDAPVLILSNNGRMVRAKLSDREDVEGALDE